MPLGPALEHAARQVGDVALEALRQPLRREVTNVDLVVVTGGGGALYGRQAADLFLGAEVRLAPGLPPEKPKARMFRVADLTEAEIQRLILKMPFRKFAQRGFLDYGRGVSRVRFAPALWKRLTAEDRHRLRDSSKQAVDRYYAAS